MEVTWIRLQVVGYSSIEFFDASEENTLPTHRTQVLYPRPIVAIAGSGLFEWEMTYFSVFCVFDEVPWILAFCSSVVEDSIYAN